MQIIVSPFEKLRFLKNLFFSVDIRSFLIDLRFQLASIFDPDYIQIALKLDLERHKWASKIYRFWLGFSHPSWSHVGLIFVENGGGNLRPMCGAMLGPSGARAGTGWAGGVTRRVKNC